MVGSRLALRNTGDFTVSSRANALIGRHVHVLGQEMDATVTHYELAPPVCQLPAASSAPAVDRIITFGGNQVFRHFRRWIGIGSRREYGATIATSIETTDSIAARIGNFTYEDGVGQSIGHIAKPGAASNIEDAVAIHATPGLGQHVGKRSNPSANAVIIAIANPSSHIAVVVGWLVTVFLTAIANIGLRRAPENWKSCTTNHQWLAVFWSPNSLPIPSAP